MSFAAQDAVKGIPLPPGPKFVLWVIAYHINEGTGEWALSFTDLKRETGQSRRAVAYHLHELERLGHVTVSRSKGRRNVYRIAADYGNHCTSATTALVQPLHPTSATTAPPPVQPLHQRTSIDHPLPSVDHPTRTSASDERTAKLRAWQQSQFGQSWLYINPGKFKAGQDIHPKALAQQAAAWAAEYPDLAEKFAAVLAAADAPRPPTPHPAPRPRAARRAAAAVAAIAR